MNPQPRLLEFVSGYRGYADLSLLLWLPHGGPEVRLGPWIGGPLIDDLSAELYQALGRDVPDMLIGQDVL